MVLKHKAGILILLLLILSTAGASAQIGLDSLKLDTTRKGSFMRRIMQQDTLVLDSLRLFKKNNFINRMMRQGIDAITVHHNDTAEQASLINVKSEEMYKQYEGRTIRQIIVNRLKFEQTVTDTTRRLAVAGTNILNALHSNTKEWVIRNNLFVKEGTKVNAYEISDNERYLRTLNFIQDARIVVMPVPGTDSVDIEVFTRDLFTITGGVDASGPKHVRANIAEMNLLGMGQMLEYTMLMDVDRSPRYGYQIIYRKNNIGGSFINGTIGYTVINPNAFDGKEEEKAYSLSLDRPLVSPYSKFAGGLYLAHEQVIKNLYTARPDSLFYSYKNNIFDVWGGINIGSRKLLTSTDIRDRRFFSVRYAQNIFDSIPYQVGEKFDQTFNGKQLLLVQLTFFRQDFYKTNYVYGFGVTEDIPYGYNVSLIAGWYKQLSLERPYAGIKLDNHIIGQHGGFIRYYVKAGTFYKNLQLDDATILVGGSVYSPLLHWRQYKFRQFFSVSYARIFNRITSEQLRIDNPFGLKEIGSGAVQGNERFNFTSETSMFLTYKLLGFRFAPFLIAQMATLTPETSSIWKSDIYTGVGGGIRTRNENLVFGTIELKGIYYPRAVDGVPSYRISLTSNIRYRYNSNYVSAPDFIRPNDDY